MLWTSVRQVKGMLTTMHIAASSRLEVGTQHTADGGGEKCTIVPGGRANGQTSAIEKRQDKRAVWRESERDGGTGSIQSKCTSIGRKIDCDQNGALLIAAV